MKIQLNRQLANTGLFLLVLAFTVLIQGCLSQANGSDDENATEVVLAQTTLNQHRESKHKKK